VGHSVIISRMISFTPRQRMLAAIRNEIPDRVPVAPDISNMVPTRLSGKGYFSVYIDQDPPLWQAYIDAVRYYGIDGWFTYGGVRFTTQDVSTSSRWLVEGDEKKVKEVTYHTPAGPLTEEILYPVDQPPMRVKRMVVDPQRDFPRFKYLLGPIVDASSAKVEEQRCALGEMGVLGVCTFTPGIHIWSDYFEGSVQAVSYLLVDQPLLLDELAELQSERLMRELEYQIAARPDFILTGGSGSITLGSPKLWRKYSLPSLQAQTARCKQAGVLTMVHSCGIQRAMVEAAAHHTDLNCINPLEIPPMGDIHLREAKQIVKGTQLALMGNLHTTNVMLNGSVEEVKAAARQAIDDASEGGGFILSTGDQCGWDTPDANIFAMLEVAETYGRYS
jgi:uroporphyrinogen decarboxylase